MTDPKKNKNLRCIEFFSGMGGYRFALERTNKDFEIVQAYDINQNANSCYESTFNHKPSTRSIANLTVNDITKLKSNVWLMSPPCQPFTRGGSNLDTLDTRSEPFLNILKLLKEIQTKPDRIMLENVYGFHKSKARDMLVDTLSEVGYKYFEFLLSPWQFGVPNERLRYYLVAKLDIIDQIQNEETQTEHTDQNKVEPTNETQTDQSLKSNLITHWPLTPQVLPTPDATSSLSLLNLEFSDLIASDIFKNSGCPNLTQIINKANHLDSKLLVPSKLLLKRNNFRFDVVNEKSHRSACFTKAYGSKHLYGSGSLLDPNEWTESTPTLYPTTTLSSLNLRFFSPYELCVLHGVPIPPHHYPTHQQKLVVPSYQLTNPLTTVTFPEDMTLIQRFKLLGNSINIVVVAELIQLLF